MLRPTEIASPERDTILCGGVPVQIRSLTSWLDLAGIDYQEWDDTDFSGPFRRSDDPWEHPRSGDGPNHRERKFFEWSRAHGLNDDTVFTLLSYNIKRIATLRNTPTELFEDMEITKGQKLILRSLMVEDSSCTFCGTYHSSPKNSCSVTTRRPHTSFKTRSQKGPPRRTRAEKNLAARCNSLPDEEFAEEEDEDPEEDPLESILKRGRRNTTGQNFGYLNCHPKYWADILPVPSKLIKML